VEAGRVRSGRSCPRQLPVRQHRLNSPWPLLASRISGSRPSRPRA
jgi:hypothetical protein